LKFTSDIEAMKQPFQFKRFSITDARCVMKVGTDAVLLGTLTDVRKALNILDIGTGSGVIAIMLAQRSNAHIDAIDIHQPSCEDALVNFKNSPWPGRLNIHHSSLADFVKATKTKYDLIVSNPPFFDKGLKSPSEEKNIAKHSGTLSFGNLLEGVKYLLDPIGYFSLILPYSERNNFISIALSHNLFLNREIPILPKAKKPANRMVLEFSNLKPEKIHYSELPIRDSSGSFHEKYVLLTNDFYLNLNSKRIDK
jgi:tRNA1Val (adenine37-N6)-methyltransferase